VEHLGLLQGKDRDRKKNSKKMKTYAVRGLTKTKSGP
jgi:hypothetical protein